MDSKLNASLAIISRQIWSTEHFSDFLNSVNGSFPFLSSLYVCNLHIRNLSDMKIRWLELESNKSVRGRMTSVFMAVWSLCACRFPVVSVRQLFLKVGILSVIHDTWCLEFEVLTIDTCSVSHNLVSKACVGYQPLKRKEMTTVAKILGIVGASVEYP